jgi:hypothetical protein
MAAPRARVTRTRVAAAEAPRGALRGFSVAGALPSGRSLLVGFGLVVVALALYLVARQPSVFAIDEVRVEGASPALSRLIGSEVA